MRSGLHNIGDGFVSGKAATLHTIEQGFVRAFDGGGGGIGGNDAFTKLLLHCDGVDGSTAFTDVSASAHTVTANGNAQVDTAQSKFGGASALFDGTSDSLSMAASSDWDLGAVGSGDFTIDFWVRFNVVASQQRLISAGTGWELYMASATSIGLWTAPATQTTWAWTPSTGTWYHVALERVTNVLRLYVNGTSLGDGTDRDMGSASNSLYIGTYVNGSTGPLNGWMDEIRVSKGIARWTSNFTPPASAYS